MKKYAKEDTAVCAVRNTHSPTGGGKHKQKSPTLLKFMNSSSSKENVPVNEVANCRTSPIDTACVGNSRSQAPALVTLALEKEEMTLGKEKMTLNPKQSLSIFSPVNHHSKLPQDGIPIPRPNLEHNKQEVIIKSSGKGSHSSTSRQLADDSHNNVAQPAPTASLLPAKPCPAVHCRSSVHSKQFLHRTPSQTTYLQDELYHADDCTGVSLPVDATPERNRTIFRVAGQKRKLLPDVGETGKPVDWPPKKKRKKQKWSLSQKENSATLKKSLENTESPIEVRFDTFSCMQFLPDKFTVMIFIAEQDVQRSKGSEHLLYHFNFLK